MWLVARAKAIIITHHFLPELIQTTFRCTKSHISLDRNTQLLSQQFFVFHFSCKDSVNYVCIATDCHSLHFRFFFGLVVNYSRPEMVSVSASKRGAYLIYQYSEKESLFIGAFHKIRKNCLFVPKIETKQNILR